MTGYGAAEGAVSGGRLAVEIRTVNHRHFNVQFKLPTLLQPLEQDLRTRLRARIERGHVMLTARWVEAAPRAAAVRVDIERARAVLAALTELQRALDLPGEIDVGFIARQPEVLTLPETGEVEIDASAVAELLGRALDEVVQMRCREGTALAADLGERLAAIAAHLSEVERQAPSRLESERDRLRRAVGELLDGASLDEARLSQEIALLAERLDISEELVRLRTHLAAGRAALAEDGAVGRRLAFLGQEMLREINTIGSKANDASIAQDVITMKGELEKFREQVENVE